MCLHNIILAPQSILDIKDPNFKHNLLMSLIEAENLPIPILDFNINKPRPLNAWQVSSTLEVNRYYLSKIPTFNSPELADYIRNSIAIYLNEILNIELDVFIKENQSKLPDGRQRLVKNGYMRPRHLVTTFGTIEINQPRMKDRAKEEEKIKFTSRLLIPYKRISDPVINYTTDLYLKGVSTGSFDQITKALFGNATKGFSASSIAKMTKIFNKKFEEWKKRDLSKKKYIFMYGDGVYFKIRGQITKECYLMVIGQTIDGRKEIVAIHPCASESKNEWLKLFTNLQNIGLSYEANIIIGDEGQGLWSAVSEIFPNAKQQFCWEHKRQNILKHFKSQENRNKVSHYFNAIYNAESKQESLTLIIEFAKEFKNNTKAVDCLLSNLSNYLTYFDFPREYWVNIKTNNPIESLFGTLRLRVNKTRGMSSSEESLSRFLFHLAMDAEKNFKMLKEPCLLQNIADGAEYINGKFSIANMQYNSIDSAA